LTVTKTDNKSATKSTVINLVNFVADTVDFIVDTVNFVASVYEAKQHGQLFRLKSTVLNSTLSSVSSGLRIPKLYKQKNANVFESVALYLLPCHLTYCYCLMFVMWQL